MKQKKRTKFSFVETDFSQFEAQNAKDKKILKIHAEKIEKSY